MRNIVATRQNRNVVATLKLRSRHKIKEGAQELCWDLSTNVVWSRKNTEYCCNKNTLSQLKQEGEQDLQVATDDCLLQQKPTTKFKTLSRHNNQVATEKTIWA